MQSPHKKQLSGVSYLRSFPSLVDLLVLHPTVVLSCNFREAIFNPPLPPPLGRWNLNRTNKGIQAVMLHHSLNLIAAFIWVYDPWQSIPKLDLENLHFCTRCLCTTNPADLCLIFFFFWPKRKKEVIQITT